MSQDPKDAKSKALVKARANGFGTGRHENPAFRTTTERFDEVMEPDLDLILRKTKRAWIRGLDSDNVKIAVDTAHKLTGHLYRPAQEVKVEHTGDTGGNTFNFSTVRDISSAEQALLARAQKALGQETAAIEAAETVEVVDEHPEA